MNNQNDNARNAERAYAAPRQVVIDALKAAKLAMCATHNTLTTDRPDLARSEETSWTINFQKEIDLIDQALQTLSNTDSDHE